MNGFGWFSLWLGRAFRSKRYRYDSQFSFPRVVGIFLPLFPTTDNTIISTKIPCFSNQGSVFRCLFSLFSQATLPGYFIVSETFSDLNDS
jgi:hypothetical protein